MAAEALERLADCPDGFQAETDGIYAVSTTNGSQERIAGPVKITAFTRDQTSGVFGFRLEWSDFRGGQHVEAYPMQLIHDQGTALAKSLAERGLEIVPGKERVLARYLGGYRRLPDVPEIRATSQLGWIVDTNGAPSYVLPDHIISTASSTEIIFQPEERSPIEHGMKPSGTLEEWNRAIAHPCRGNPYLIFCIALGFTGPLLRFAKQECGGFHLFGQSSRGKTTAAQIAASVNGCGSDPADTPALSQVQRWNTTVNALEGLSAHHNDGLLILDELGTCTAKDYDAAVYNLLGGKGKQRLTKICSLRPPRTWLVAVLSTGELSSSEKIEELGKTARTGQQVRLVDIPIVGNIIRKTHGDRPELFVRKLKTNCAQYFGTAGPAFIQELVREYGDEGRLSATVQMRVEERLNSFQISRLPPEQQRVARRFALTSIAGEMACKLGIVNLDSAEFIDSALELFRLWRTGANWMPEEARAIANIQGFVQRNEFRFEILNDGIGKSDPVRDRAGYIDYISGQRTFLFTAEAFREACGGLSSRLAAKSLSQSDLLYVNETGRFNVKYKINDDRPRLFAVYASVLDWDYTDNGAVGAD